MSVSMGGVRESMGWENHMIRYRLLSMAIVHGYCPRPSFHLHWVSVNAHDILKNKISCSSGESECTKDMINPILNTKGHGEFKNRKKSRGNNLMEILSKVRSLAESKEKVEK